MWVWDKSFRCRRNSWCGCLSADVYMQSKHESKQTSKRIIVSKKTCINRFTIWISVASNKHSKQYGIWWTKVVASLLKITLKADYQFTNQQNFHRFNAFGERGANCFFSLRCFNTPRNYSVKLKLSFTVDYFKRNLHLSSYEAFIQGCFIHYMLFVQSLVISEFNGRDSIIGMCDIRILSYLFSCSFSKRALDILSSSSMYWSVPCWTHSCHIYLNADDFNYCNTS